MTVFDIQTLILGWATLCTVGLAGVGALSLVRGLRRPTPPAGAVEAARPTPEEAARLLAPRPEPIDLWQGLRRSRAALVGRLERVLRGRQELDAVTLGQVYKS